MVTQNPTPPHGGHTGHPPSGDASSSSHVYMFNETTYLMTREKTYDTPPRKTSSKSVANGDTNDMPSIYSNPSYGPIQIEKPTIDSLFFPPKSTI
jgi:hypothetical protein